MKKYYTIAFFLEFYDLPFGKVSDYPNFYLKSRKNDPLIYTISRENGI